MKSIRYTLARAATVAVLVAVFATCSTIREDLDDCGIRLYFKYDYNMQYTDLFPEEVKRVDVFVFDADGTFLFSRTASEPEISSPSYSMDLTGLASGVYQIVAWAGLSDDYDLPQLKQNESSINDLILCFNSAITPGGQSPLWYGRILDFSYEKGHPRTETVSLLKNTNNFTIILSAADGSIMDMEPDGCSFEIIAGDCSYNQWDRPVDDSNITYLPPQSVSVENGKLTARITVMRLLDNKTATLRICNPVTGAVITEIDLMQYIRALYDNGAGPGMSFEEYLDREDEFVIEIVYEGSGQYTAVSIIINGWVIWLNDAEL